MELNNHIRPLLKISRINAGLTHEQVCNRASEREVIINPESLEAIENEQRDLPDEIMYALLEVFELTLAMIEEAVKDVGERLGLE